MNPATFQASFNEGIDSNKSIDQLARQSKLLSTPFPAVKKRRFSVRQRIH